MPAKRRFAKAEILLAFAREAVHTALASYAPIG